MLVLQPFEKIRNNEVENHLIQNVQNAEKNEREELDFVISLIKISIEMKM